MQAERMAIDESRNNERGNLAIGAGVVAGLATALIISGIVWAAGSSINTTDEASQSDRVQSSDFSSGTCIELKRDDEVVVTEVDCAEPHDAQITTVLDYSEGDDSYPGGPALSQWAGPQCDVFADTYLGSDILDTTLVETMLHPTEQAWALGDRAITCYVAQLSGVTLQGSLQGQGLQFARGEVILIARLKVGDCYVPVGDNEAFNLTSNSEVLLVDCESPFIGMLFGRGELQVAVGLDYPGTEELKALSGDRCSAEFKNHFKVDSSGFNFRYFRPNEQSWLSNDRSILCSILDEAVTVGGFDPTKFEPFFQISPGVCFNSGPGKQSMESVRLTDMVLPVDCSVTHVGQMIGSGELTGGATSEIPDGGIGAQVDKECEAIYIEFMGFPPFGTVYGTFSFWSPTEAQWLEGERRFICSFFRDDLPPESVQGLGQNQES